jgi:hypothetical protein
MYLLQAQGITRHTVVAESLPGGFTSERTLATFLLPPASNRSAKIESSAPLREALIPIARQRSPMERPPKARRSQLGESKWQATESSKSPMQTSTRMF